MGARFMVLSLLPQAASPAHPARKGHPVLRVLLVLLVLLALLALLGLKASPDPPGLLAPPVRPAPRDLPGQWVRRVTKARPVCVVNKARPGSTPSDRRANKGRKGHVDRRVIRATSDRPVWRVLRGLQARTARRATLDHPACPDRVARLERRDRVVLTG